VSLNFSPDALLKIILAMPHARRYVVAYSGGVDSHVLLQALASMRDELPGRLAACHVNHGLNRRAGEWADHCRHVCETLGVAFHSDDIDAVAPRGQSQEAWARRLRYQALQQRMDKGDMLLTAHQADDQAETLLLQLLRGAGPAGLASMPAVQPFGQGWHARPLLGFSREDLKDYARAAGLSWVEDESNLDLSHDRNFLRREALPLLARRWPALTATLGRAAALQAEAADLLQDLAGIDLQACYDTASGTLDLAGLRELSPARQRNLLRHWLKRRGLTVPDHRRLQAIQTDLIPAREDAQPCVSWPGVEIRRYRERLFALEPVTAGTQARRWELCRVLSLPLGELRARRVQGRGMRVSSCPGDTVTVQFRLGGEAVRRTGRAHHQLLKKLFQEQGIPPWLRGSVPLVYADGHLASVAGVWLADEYAAGADEEGWEIEWTAAGEVFGKE
jgi:tRNA(Ile)-lysidine synthase